MPITTGRHSQAGQQTKFIGLLSSRERLVPRLDPLIAIFTSEAPHLDMALRFADHSPRGHRVIGLRAFASNWTNCK